VAARSPTPQGAASRSPRHLSWVEVAATRTPKPLGLHTPSPQSCHAAQAAANGEGPGSYVWNRRTHGAQEPIKQARHRKMRATFSCGKLLGVQGSRDCDKVKIRLRRSHPATLTFCQRTPWQMMPRTWAQTLQGERRAMHSRPVKIALGRSTRASDGAGTPTARDTRAARGPRKRPPKPC
jgi:hypothetical protein